MLTDGHITMRIHSAKELGLLIRQGRRARRLSQQSLASRIGVSRFWVIAVEAGKPSAEVGLVLKALGALGIALVADANAESPAAAGVADIDAIVRAARTPGHRSDS